MKRWIIGLVALLCIGSVTSAQNAPDQGDVQSFDLTPQAPPTPALKYTFLFRPIERREGNAALLYDQARESIKADDEKALNEAMDALGAKNDTRFNAVTDHLELLGIPTLLELAGRCDRCDWEAPIRDQGISVLLPYLNGTRMIANYLMVRATRQVRAGQIDQALATIRLGFELGHHIGQEPKVLIGGMVGQGIIAMMWGPLREVMNDPHSPNLYWALASLPQPMVSLKRSMDQEGNALLLTFPQLRKPDDLTADEWKAIFKEVVVDVSQGSMAPASQRGWANPQTVADEMTRNLPAAVEHYMQSRNLPQDQVEKIDPFKLVACMWLDQYVAMNDDTHKLTSLPYPIMFDKAVEVTAREKQTTDEQPANPFPSWSPEFPRLVRRSARIDREMVALAAIEAIRSYAAQHDGALPAQLSDITDTPVLDDPTTSKPFDYHVQGDMAVLSDTGQPMGMEGIKYTVRIRK